MATSEASGALSINVPSRPMLSKRAATSRPRCLRSMQLTEDESVTSRLGKKDSSLEAGKTTVIKMATAENFLIHDMILEKLAEPGFFNIDKTMLSYNDGRGHPILRHAIADFLTDRTGTPQAIDPDQLIVMNGSTPCIEALVYSIGDPQDALLCPTPYYGTINRNTRFRPELQLYPVHLSSKPRPGETCPFQLTVARLEEALQEALKKGICVRGLFLINPNNPLGDIYDPELIMDILHFCKRHSLHVIFDEVYLTSVFGLDATNSSILGFKKEDIPDPERTHFIWSFSKDFGLCGMRVGVIHTWNDRIKQVLSEIADLQQVSACVQHMMTRLLNDKEFLDTTFFPTNHQRLREAHTLVADGLKALGIPYLHRHATLFIWADFSKYLHSQTFEAEQALLDCFLENGVAMRPSRQFFGAEPGWFRIVFSIEKEMIKTGLARISAVCYIQKDQTIKSTQNPTLSQDGS